MRPAILLYALWCVGIVGLSVVANNYAWSPFADGRQGPRGGGGGIIFVGGPNHK